MTSQRHGCMKDLSALCRTITQRSKRMSGSKSISAASKVMHISVVDGNGTPATKVLSIMSDHLCNYSVSTINPGDIISPWRH